MSDPMKPIHVWTPGIRDDTGGIQAFSRFFVRALSEGFPERPLRVFVRNEAPDAADRWAEQGIQVHSFEGLPFKLRSHVLAASAATYALRERPACLLSTHLHFLPALHMLRALIGAPYGGVLHGIEAWRVRSRLRVRSMQGADRLLAVSQFTRDQVVGESGVRPERVSVFPNTFDATRFTPGAKPQRLLAKYGLRPDQPVLLTVSRLALSERYKGHWQVLLALRQVLRQMPDVHYLIVGTGDEAQHLRDGLRALGLENRVTLAGFISTADLPDHYRLCDAFVMPSTNEGFGIVFLEAVACGKPVIGGFLDGSFDALDGGRLGILTDPHCPEKIAQDILTTLSGKHENRLLYDAPALSQAVRERFGFDAFKQRLIGEIRPLLEPAAAASPAVVPVAPPMRQRLPAPGVGRAPRIVVMTQLNSPYQVEFFNRIAQAGQCHLEVIYLTHRDKHRQWAAADIAHAHIILSQSPHLEKSALESLQHADLAVFNYYTSRFAWRAIRSRAATGKPWVFWGERPGFLNLGPPGAWFRRLALKPLHRSLAPIWGIGHWGIVGYRTEFGVRRSYHNLPYHSELGRFHSSRTVPPVGARTFFYSGALSERKGVELLARAFVQVAAEHAHARLILQGSGPLESKLREILAPCAAQVEFSGFRSWQELPLGYARGDIFCLPSRYDGWGLALVEALASSMPAIATDMCGAAVDLIRPGHNGWLAKADDEGSLQQAMREALALPTEAFAAMQGHARRTSAPLDAAEGAKKFIQLAHDALVTWPGGGTKAP